MKDKFKEKEFPTYQYMSIEPRLVSQQKQLDRYREVLNITLPQEDFVLKCILSFDWKRECIIREIINIKGDINSTQFRVDVTAPNHIVDYSCSNPLRESGWSLDSEQERCWYVYYQLNRYITR